MDELLIRVLTRLLRVHDELGKASYEEAAHRALLAIALAVQFDAERKAGNSPTDKEAKVVKFPLGHPRRKVSPLDTE